MCLTIPMQIKSIDEFQAVCFARGVERVTSLFMMQGVDLKVGDFVLIQTGYAVQKVSETDAHAAWESFDEIMAMLESPDSPGQQDE